MDARIPVAILCIGSGAICAMGGSVLLAVTLGVCGGVTLAIGAYKEEEGE